jgi:hypothetical protein
LSTRCIIFQELSAKDGKINFHILCSNQWRKQDCSDNLFVFCMSDITLVPKGRVARLVLGATPPKGKLINRVEQASGNQRPTLDRC